MKIIRIPLLSLGLLANSLLASSAIYAQTDTQLADAIIEGQLTSTFTLNEQLNPFTIDVDSNDGVVTLTGNVESEIERELAVELANHVEGVTQVDDQLQVVPDIERHEISGGFAASVENATTTAKIKSQLLWNSQTDGLDIQINTHSGIVTLDGVVASEAEAAQAERIAKNTTGVKSVINQLTVDPESDRGVIDKTKEVAKETATAIKDKAKNVGDAVKNTAQDVGNAVKDTAENVETTVKDTWITTKVRSLMTLDRRFEHTDLDVKTKQGVVTLSGNVPASLNQEDLVEAIQYVKGVKEVDVKQLQIAK